MESENYWNGRLGEDYLVDPSQQFNLDLDLQHVLLGDYNLAGDFYCSDDQLKGSLFDEDEGFDEDYDHNEMLQHAVITGQSNSQHDRCGTAADPVISNIIDTTLAYANTITTAPAVSSVTSFIQAGSHDIPDSNIDDCYGNSIWTNDAPMQLISTRDHMMSSPVKLHKAKPLSRESSPPAIHYQEQSVSSHDRLPSHEEVVSMPFYKFKRLLDSPSLSGDDKLKAKAIRKKGKNKSAARNCRERKMAMLEGLDQEVAILQQQRASLLKQKAQLFAETKLWETKCASLQ